MLHNNGMQTNAFFHVACPYTGQPVCYCAYGASLSRQQSQHQQFNQALQPTKQPSQLQHQQQQQPQPQRQSSQQQLQPQLQAQPQVQNQAQGNSDSLLELWQRWSSPEPTTAEQPVQASEVLVPCLYQQKNNQEELNKLLNEKKESAATIRELEKAAQNAALKAARAAAIAGVEYAPPSGIQLQQVSTLEKQVGLQPMADKQSRLQDDLASLKQQEQHLMDNHSTGIKELKSQREHLLQRMKEVERQQAAAAQAAARAMQPVAAQRQDSLPLSPNTGSALQTLLNMGKRSPSSGSKAMPEELGGMRQLQHADAKHTRPQDMAKAGGAKHGVHAKEAGDKSKAKGAAWSQGLGPPGGAWPASSQAEQHGLAAGKASHKGAAGSRAPAGAGSVTAKAAAAPVPGSSGGSGGATGAAKTARRTTSATAAGSGGSGATLKQTGKVLTRADIKTDLTGRMLKLLWPEDGTWWDGQIVQMDPSRHVATIFYASTEQEEEVDLLELVDKKEVAWFPGEGPQGPISSKPTASIAGMQGPGMISKQAQLGAQHAAAAADKKRKEMPTPDDRTMKKPKSMLPASAAPGQQRLQSKAGVAGHGSAHQPSGMGSIRDDGVGDLLTLPQQQMLGTSMGYSDHMGWDMGASLLQQPRKNSGGWG